MIEFDISFPVFNFELLLFFALGATAARSTREPKYKIKFHSEDSPFHPVSKTILFFIVYIISNYLLPANVPFHYFQCIFCEIYLEFGLLCHIRLHKLPIAVFHDYLIFNSKDFLYG